MESSENFILPDSIAWVQNKINECYFYLLIHEKRIVELMDKKNPDGTPFIDVPEGKLKFRLKFHEFQVRKIESELSTLYEKLIQYKKEEDEGSQWGGHWTLWEVHDRSWIVD